MSVTYQGAELAEKTNNNRYKQEMGLRLVAALVIIIHSVQYLFTALAWFAFLSAILYAAGVIPYLSSYDDSFRYMQYITPLTSPKAVTLIIGGYVISLPILQWIMKNQKPITLPKLVAIHNLLLMTMSAYLAAGISYFIIKDIWANGFFHSICSAESHDNSNLHYLYYLNYLLKFYEFIDTYIIILKKRNVIFLHWYHHAVTALLTYIQQNDYTPVQWVPILMNLLVHVVMYSYYLLSSLHVNVWWKRYLTQFQILQFVVDLSVCIYCTVQLNKIPKTCDGTMRAAYSGVGIIGSYFLLFLKFYATSYTKKSKKE